jgi:predicted transcriptional regulator
MNTVTLEIASRETTNRRFAAAMEGSEQGAVICFASPRLLFKILSGRRWDLLNTMTGAGPLKIRELARRTNRDVKAVHTDVHALLDAGILKKTDMGEIVFPYDVLHVDFLLKAA